MTTDYIKNMLEARVYDVAVETPISQARFLSERLNNTVLIKREDLQPVYSFKIRGAYNKITVMPPDVRKRGVIAASAGNHAQGVAVSGQKLGIRTIIVMPTTTPDIKVQSVKALGAHVILLGDTFDQALAHALELAEEKGFAFIHPYDDPDVIAGQGTVALEILRQHSGQMDAVFVPVGGGGLIAGMAMYIKYLRPDIKVIGVEAEESACLTAALKAGKRVVLPEVGIFADGVAVAQIGKTTFEICKKYVDGMVTVNNDEICAAVKDLFNDTRSIAEPAGALGLAGLKKYVEENNIKDQVLLTVETGANVNFDKLRTISEQAEVGEHREAIYAVDIPEHQGSFRDFVAALSDHNITEFNYRLNDIHRAQVFISVQLTEGSEERHRLVKALESKHYSVIDLTDNEPAKRHVRHMIGGHLPPEADPERIFHVQIPERAGALLRFLDALKGQWNVSLFHYRSEGALYGRVMLGVQVADDEVVQLKAVMDEVGYRYREDTDNPAFQYFLKQL